MATTSAQRLDKLIAKELQKMRRAASNELPDCTRDSVLRTSDHFINELENLQPANTTSVYGICLGLKRREYLHVVQFLKNNMPEFMQMHVFGYNTPGIKSLSQQTGCRFFVRLDLSIPLAIALLVPELQRGRL